MNALRACHGYNGGQGAIIAVEYTLSKGHTFLSLLVCNEFLGSRSAPSEFIIVIQTHLFIRQA